MSEQPNLSPEANKLPEKPKALDAEWYKRYEDIASLQAYEYFDDPIEDRRTEARKKLRLILNKKNIPILTWNIPKWTRRS